jgi:hypothetical protein
MLIDVTCGGEVVSLETNEIIPESLTYKRKRFIDLLYNEGERYFANETYQITPDSLTLSVDKDKCPFVSFTIFEDEDY